MRQVSTDGAAVCLTQERQGLERAFTAFKADSAAAAGAAEAQLRDARRRAKADGEEAAQRLCRAAEAQAASNSELAGAAATIRGLEAATQAAGASIAALTGEVKGLQEALAASRAHTGAASADAACSAAARQAAALARPCSRSRARATLRLRDGAPPATRARHAASQRSSSSSQLSWAQRAPATGSNTVQVTSRMPSSDACGTRERVRLGSMVSWRDSARVLRGARGEFVRPRGVAHRSRQAAAASNRSQARRRRWVNNRAYSIPCASQGSQQRIWRVAHHRAARLWAAA